MTSTIRLLKHTRNIETGGVMRSFRRTTALCLLMVVLIPRPAHAWFEWLDRLSGPGPFYGVIFDSRVYCWGNSVGFGKLDNAIASAVFKTLAVNSATTNAAAISTAKQADTLWSSVWADFQDIHDRVPSLDDESQGLANLKVLVSALKLADFPNGGRISESDLLPIINGLRVQTALLYKSLVSLASTGIFLSFCQHDSLRTFALEVGYSTMQANSNPLFANDYTIRLNMYTAGLSYRIPKFPKWDVVDVGAKGGVYQFSSRGLPLTVTGIVIEPFVDVHGPTRWINAGGLRSAASLVTFRANFVLFPGGFDTAKQFAASGDGVEIISGSKMTFSGTVFFNLTPLLLRHVPALPQSAPAVVH